VQVCVVSGISVEGLVLFGFRLLFAGLGFLSFGKIVFLGSRIFSFAGLSLFSFG
jgi:hypothetical protein